MPPDEAHEGALKTRGLALSPDQLKQWAFSVRIICEETQTNLADGARRFTEIGVDPESEAARNFRDLAEANAVVALFNMLVTLAESSPSKEMN